MKLEEAFSLIGKNLYGNSYLNKDGIYTYKVVGVGRFLDRNYSETRDGLLLDLISNSRDLTARIYCIGRSSSARDFAAIDEIGKTYFLTKEEMFDYIVEEAKRRLEPKGPIFSSVWSNYRCPICNRSFSQEKPKCGYCGQVLDWSGCDDKV